MEKGLISSETLHQPIVQSVIKQYSTNRTLFMSVKCTKEFRMIENNENKRKRKFMISFTSQTELALRREIICWSGICQLY